MKTAKLEKIDSHLVEKLKNKTFKKHFEFERAKVALAQKLAQMREEEKLRQADLAKRLGVSQQFVSQIETAQEKNITIDTLLRIAKSLGRNVKISFPKISGKNAQLKIA